MVLGCGCSRAQDAGLVKRSSKTIFTWRWEASQKHIGLRSFMVGLRWGACSNKNEHNELFSFYISPGQMK